MEASIEDAAFEAYMGIRYLRFDSMKHNVHRYFPRAHPSAVGTTSSSDGEPCLWYDGEEAVVRGDGEGTREDHQEVPGDDW
jgi:hypothetical protein